MLHGKVITGDAMLTQHKIAKQIVEHGGDYLLAVKDNQPLLREDIQALFEAPHTLDLTPQELASERSVREVSMHGNRIEERVLRASTYELSRLPWLTAMEVPTTGRSCGQG